MHHNGLQWWWGLIPTHSGTAEEESINEGTRHLEYIHSSDIGTKTVAFHESVPQGFEECQCIPQQKPYSQTRWHECV